MSSSNKKLDNITDKPGILPYASNIGAPKIEPNNLNRWKENKSENLNKYFNERYEEVKDNYLKLIKEYELNKLVYNAKFEFIPIIGKIYYLYESKPQNFLSLIDPNQWNQNFIGAFKLVSENRWKKIEYKK
ncbi:MAG: GTP-binding protein [Candidatus Marinimicrobia bacterium]|nr:GTP-binding protein [Candidatus Neomarinimicrobiota bacterium]|tara:strand:+ start:4829 stop:5221 length:393 start_codon:yes stop_codon:yes gene_type:complete